MGQADSRVGPAGWAIVGTTAGCLAKYHLPGPFGSPVSGLFRGLARAALANELECRGLLRTVDAIVEAEETLESCSPMDNAAAAPDMCHGLGISDRDPPDRVEPQPNHSTEPVEPQDGKLEETRL